MRVVKVGGSLFDLPDLATRLQTWLETNNDQRNLLLAGGGKFVDCVREAQTVHQFDDVAAHWISIETMSSTSRLLHALLPDSMLTDNLETAISGDWPVVVWQPLAWLAGREDLPQGWGFTSDSIAACLAVETQAAELVLLKSCDSDDAGDDFVDQGFEQIASAVPSCKFVNFREWSV